jgi:ComF family protein
VAPFRYEEPIRHLIHALKFRDRVAPARLLGHLFADEWSPENGEKPQCLIAVPLHPGRYRMRGYNQSLEIARVVSRRLDIPLRLHGCERILSTLPQSELSATGRRRNVRGAFRVAEPVNGKHVAILDDIVTTGATVSELAKTLRKAGVERVDVWAVARA